jgi:hypothetical protein
VGVPLMKNRHKAVSKGTVELSFIIIKRLLNKNKNENSKIVKGNIGPFNCSCACCGIICSFTFEGSRVSG